MQPNQYRDVRLEKLEKLKALGIEAWPRKAKRTHGLAELATIYADAEAWPNEKLEGLELSVSVMGRILTIREMGKSVFAHLTENGEKIQGFFRMNDLSETSWETIKLLDMGDFISVTGPLMRTKTGELSVRVKEIQFLSKALLPLPEKWHGLQDKEQRYRQRYLDLVSNGDVLKTFQTRSRIVSAVRRFMEDQGYLEVETPMMQPIPGGATARPFITHHNALDMALYLRIAPELYLKRLIVGGFEKVFEINRNFRNEGLSVRHNPEFTMMEFYAAGQDLRDMMALTEGLISTVARSVVGSEALPWGEQVISYAAPFRRLTMKDAIAEYGGIDRHLLEDGDSVRALARTVHVEDVDKKTVGFLLGDLFEYHVEKQLVQPTFITDYPIELSPLTKTLEGDDRFVDRFELFIGGMEIANAYSELNDPIDQMGRFQAQMDEREAGNDEAMLLDQDFITSLEHGFPPCGGEGIGIDRLVMLLTNSASIRDVILFPLMRPTKPQEGGETE
ncbi:MAG: lysine--tRNA ligase [Geothrix sp.]|uniref:lysine--tRNA ligase n=1 Tax=Geothrix sp. TaxID=1962974 RepID=UPI001842A299|nr:lysine--tRNA ligase [Geothrix sp.]NWJ40759.1 lysine--tRNA ligase [Geothrix sp.]WIL21235.1 MAG: lysine--tRNA ligase [Geothrix sp.]